MSFNHVLIFAFGTNLVLSYYDFNDAAKEMGIDYIAYIQQAAAVWNGETNYTKISSTLGPCFYPGGHLFQYMAFLSIHYLTENAIQIVKVIHYFIYSTIIVFLIKICKVYFKDGNRTAQFIAFVLVSNMNQRRYLTEMYNDGIMFLYLVIGIYFAITNRPLMASAFLTIGLSIKVAVILILPGFLGSV